MKKTATAMVVVFALLTACSGAANSSASDLREEIECPFGYESAAGASSNPYNIQTENNEEYIYYKRLIPGEACVYRIDPETLEVY